MRCIRAILVMLVAAATPAVGQIDSAIFEGMPARNIGPAGMSGRVAVVTAVESDLSTMYVGTATGGIWKSVDRGITWIPIFDDQPASSIGDIAVFQPVPDIVWAGTGEGNVRNSAGVGNGIYKSLDAGATWIHLGLEHSERIHRVVLHPSDPDIAYLAVMGPTWSDGEERGVYRTTDGGSTWERVLYVNERTGAADLVMDPTNPNKLFAALWEHRREPWFFTSGGPGSGLYVTHDGGDNWKRFGEEDGLPKGELGRMGLAMAQSDPAVIYALVEAERSALLRSDDGGQKWQTVNDSVGIVERPFYYADIRVDPRNENRLYTLAGQVSLSEDGGKTFRVLAGSGIHGDVHSLWIDPNDNRTLLLGDDGGVRISHDRGEHWRFAQNIPVAQFYHLNVDMATPFNVYGGLQDNGSWVGPSAVWTGNTIRNSHWRMVGFGDGFATFRDFSDPRYIYSMWQGGRIGRFDTTTGQLRDLQPEHPDGTRLRFSWNAGLNVDPFDSTTMYLGSQFVHRTRDHGATWEIISPDLTTDNPEKQRSDVSGGLTVDASGAENHTTILTIAPSPVERGVIWVGTDDGNLQITRDGGATWSNVINRIDGVPDATWVPHIEASKFDGGEAFVVFDDHRRGNWTSYVYRTADYGRNWQSLATDDLRGFVHVIEQDPVVRDLLFLGTEFGLYLSFNGGGTWIPWRHGMPTVPVRALIVHPRDHDLVIGTHGRAAYILDDIRPLRALARGTGALDTPLQLFEPPPAVALSPGPGFWGNAPGMLSSGDAVYAGQNRTRGALLTYWVAEGIDTAKVAIEILEGDSVIRRLEAPQKRGLNRATWDLRQEDFDVPETGFFGLQGPQVLPGRYGVRVVAAADTATRSVEVRADPRAAISTSQRDARVVALMRMGQRAEVIKEALDRITRTKAQIETVLGSMEGKDDSAATALRDAAKTLGQQLDSLSARFIDPPDQQGLFPYESRLLPRLMFGFFLLDSSADAPTEAQMLRLQRIESQLETTLERFNRVFADDVSAFRAQALAAGFELLGAQEPLTMGWEQRDR